MKLWKCISLETCGCNLMNKSHPVKTSRKHFTLLTLVRRQLHLTLMNCGRAREIRVNTSIGQGSSRPTDLDEENRRQRVAGV